VPSDRDRDARHLGVSLAAALLLLAGFACLVIATVLALVAPQPIEGLPGFSQRQPAETALYVALVTAGLPLAVAVGPRWGALLIRRHGGGSGALAELAVFALLLTVVVTAFRLFATSSIGGEPFYLALAAAFWWFVLVLRASHLARRRHALPRSPDVHRGRQARLVTLCLATAIALPVFVYPFLFARSSALRAVPLGLVTVGGIAVWLAAATGLRSRLVARRSKAARWALHGRRSTALEIAVLLVVLPALAVNVVLFEPGPSTLPLSQRVFEWVVAFHANFLLGPANQLAHGGTMLVDTVSQYGVGSIVALSGVLDALSPGYGGVGLFDGILTTLALFAAWIILRAAGVRLPLAVLALAVSIVVLLWGRVFPVGTIVQDGAFRTGIAPWVIVGWLLARRRPALGQALAGSVIAIAAVWSFEVFVLTTATWFALVAAEAWLSPRDSRKRLLVRRSGFYAGAAAIGHTLFVTWTLARSGDWPNWLLYADFLRAFLLGQLREVTYDFTRWSPGLGLGGAYLAQAAVLGALMVHHRELARSLGLRFPVLVALAVYGLACFFYLVDRSLDHVVIYVAQPLVLSGALWLDELLRRRAIRLGSLPGLALTAWLAIVLGLALSATWPKIRPAARDTLAWQAVHGPQRLVDRWQRLRDFPPVDAEAENGAELLRRYLPGTSSALVLMPADRAVETLVRAGKRNQLPLSFTLSDSFIAQEPDSRMQRMVRSALRRIRPGELALVDGSTRFLMAAAREGKVLDLPRSVSVDKLRVDVITSLGRRFSLRVLARRGDNYLVRLIG